MYWVARTSLLWRPGGLPFFFWWIETAREEHLGG